MLLAINPHDSRPAYQQIVAAVKGQIHEGLLRPGDELPSVRELARELGIHLHTARHAYQVLREQGVLRLRWGSRARIAPLRQTPAAEAELRIAGRLQELVADAFHLGLSVEQFRAMVEQAWSKRGIDKQDAKNTQEDE